MLCLEKWLSMRDISIRKIKMTNIKILDCTLRVGDSLNDYEAAKANGIKFYAFNNFELKELDGYIEKFEDFEDEIKK